MRTAVLFSLAHSLLCVPLLLWGLWEVGWWWRFDENSLDDRAVHDFWWGTTPATGTCVGFSALYFAWDILHELWQKGSRNGSWANLCHACVGFTAYAVIGWWFAIGHITLCLSLLNELSTPFYNLYVLASDHLRVEDENEIYQSYQSAIWRQKMAGLVFAIVFFLVRIAWLPLYMWCRVKPFIAAGLQSDHSFAPALVAVVELAVSYGLNFYWFALILRRALKQNRS